jgi:hypothetical protein
LDYHVLREAFIEVIHTGLSARRITRQSKSQRRLRLRIGAFWRESQRRRGTVASQLFIVEERFANRCVRLPQRSRLFFVAAACGFHSLPG